MGTSRNRAMCETPWIETVSIHGRRIFTRIAAALLVAAAAVDPASAAAPWVSEPAWSPPDIGTIAAGDLDGDGRVDLLFGHDSTTAPLTAYRNTGTSAAPAWTAASTWAGITLCNTAGRYAPALADLDGDGLLDLILGTGSTVCIYRNTGTPATPVWTRADGSGTVPDWESGLTPALTYSDYAPAVADLDGDGRPDLVVSDIYGSLTAFRNVGPGAAPAMSPAWQAEGSWVPSDNPPAGADILQTTLALADLNGDGRTDLVEARGDGTGYVYAYANSGTAAAPAWTYAPAWSLFPGGVSGTGIAAIDLDGDRRPDLVHGTLSGTEVYRQDAAGMGDPGSTSGPAPLSGVVKESFDTFSCDGGWQPDSHGPNTSYYRYCANGWTAYAEDAASTATSPPAPGPVGDQSTVTLDAGANGPSSAPAAPPGSAVLSTGPGPLPRGVLWLTKSFPVTPGSPVQLISADIRAKYTGTGQSYGLMVFDGQVTAPYGQTAVNGVPLRDDLLGYSAFSSSSNSSAGTCAGIAVGSWCPWQAAQPAGQQYLWPTASYITVAFRVADGSLNDQPAAEIDNLVVSNVAAPTGATASPGTIAQLWASGFLPGGSDNTASAADIAADAAGNVYVTGTMNSGVNFDIVTVKYDDTGTPVAPWPLIYDGPSANDDEAVAMTLDANGDVVVVGRSFNGTDNDYVVMKYAPSGSTLWAQIYDNAGRDDVPAAVAVDNSGNVFVTGRSCGPPSGCDYATVAFGSAAGTLLWSRAFDAGSDDRAAAVKLDALGNVYVTGRSRGTSDDAVTVKYDPSGTQLWTARFDSGTNDYASVLAVTADGQSYVGGYTYYSSAGQPVLLLLKYGSDGGAPLWEKTYGGTTAGAMPAAMVIDAAGSVYLTGRTGLVSDFDILTLKYLADGTLAWVQTRGNSGLNDQGVDLALDPGGTLYVLGTLTSNAGNADFLTLKYSPAGTESDAITYDGAKVADTPAALALGVDTQGDTIAYVAGTSVDNVTGLGHIETVRYERAQPDLTITGLAVPPVSSISGSITITDTVLNISDVANKVYADTGPFAIDYYLAPASDPADRSILLGGRSLPDLAPGQSSLVDTALTVPSFVAPGSYVVTAVADSGGVVAEADETNNTYTSTPFNLGLPDLKVALVDASTTAMSRGGTYTVTTTVQNVGAFDTPDTPFRVGIYLSTDAVIDGSDILIGSRSISGIAASAGDTADTTVTIPTTMASGSYYLGAIADDQGTVAETDETNNSGLYQPPGNRVLLDTDVDFGPGLSQPGTSGVEVSGTGPAASLGLGKDGSPDAVAWQSPSPAWSPPLPPSTIQLAAFAFGNLDGDAAGTLDMIAGVGNLSGSRVYGYVNASATQPDWTYQSAWNLTNPCGSDFGAYPVLVDLDGDGLQDLVIGTRYHMCIYRNTGGTSGPAWTRADGSISGTPNWESGLPSAGGTASGFFGAAAADMDGDGFTDLMIGVFSTGDVNGYKFSGIDTDAASPTFGQCRAAVCWTPQTAWDVAGFGNRYRHPALTDLDNDGRIDMLVGSNTGVIDAYRNVCTDCASGPLWTAGPGSWSGASVGNVIASPSFADLTGDGRPELLVGGDSSNTSAAAHYQPFVIVAPYLSSGTYLSAPLDAGVHGGFTTLSYAGIVPQDTTLQVDIRAGDTAAPDAAWTPWINAVASGGDISQLGTHRYVQYQITLGTTPGADGLTTPQLDNIEALTQPSNGPSQVISVSYGSGGGGGGVGWGANLLLAVLVLVRRRPPDIQPAMPGGTLPAG